MAEAKEARGKEVLANENPLPAARLRNIIGRVSLQLKINMLAFDPEAVAGLAVAAQVHSDRSALDGLRALPVPVYATDHEGWITFHNAACAAFAGKKPMPGEDRWCVSWKLRTPAGAPLNHDACPMADCVRLAEPVRGLKAIAERPDGKLFAFSPYPTPFFGADGTLLGAINLFANVYEEVEASKLNAEAHRYRRIAGSLGNRDTVAHLLNIAADYEAEMRHVLTRH